MTFPPLVTIVIPTFNQGQYLPACISHCMFQTYENLEIIVVDGGSTDMTKKYLSGLDNHHHWKIVQYQSIYYLLGTCLS